MEEITNLISQARNSIKEIETYVFENQKSKYINLKTVTTNMSNQIDTIEGLAPVAIEDAEYIEAAKEDLSFIINSCNELKGLYATKNVTLMVKDDGNFSADISEIEIEKEVDDNQELLTSLNEDRIETEMPTASIDENAIMQTISGLEEVPQEQEADSYATMSIPTTNPDIVIEQEDNFEKDLDIDAINAFLNSADTSAGIRL